VAAIAAILDEDGYLAGAEPLADGGGWLIVEQNCAIFDVAIRCGTACSSELAFLREALPDTEVRRVSHMVAGAPHCAYEIRPVAAAGPAASVGPAGPAGSGEPGGVDG
jgi:DeoR family transcriptional regulator, suf operon transcriptional repressor